MYHGTNKFKERHLNCVCVSVSASRSRWWSFQGTQSNPITGLDRPWGFQEVEASRCQDNRNM